MNDFEQRLASVRSGETVCRYFARLRREAKAEQRRARRKRLRKTAREQVAKPKPKVTPGRLKLL